MPTQNEAKPPTENPGRIGPAESFSFPKASERSERPSCRRHAFGMASEGVNT